MSKLTHPTRKRPARLTGAGAPLAGGIGAIALPGWRLSVPSNTAPGNDASTVPMELISGP